MEQRKSPALRVEGMIYLIRGQRVMLDSDLATLYGVKTKELNKAMSRNRDRLLTGFMFLVGTQDDAILRSQFVTLKGHGKHAKYPPTQRTRGSGEYRDGARVTGKMA